MAAIDAQIVVGLAGKLAEVFADTNTYQAYPLSPIGLRATNLKALNTDALGAGAASQAEFATLVNSIPNGPIWFGSNQGSLWDVYGEMLTRAELMESTRTAEQQEAYDRAFRQLYVKDEDNVPKPSATVLLYEQHRDRYLAATMEYNNRRGEAEVSGIPEVKRAWEADEPRLRDEVEAASAAWIESGSRGVVEEARRVIRDLGSDTPETVWAGALRLFDPSLPEIFFRTTPEGLRYLPTAYIPSDAVDMAWPRITVTSDELARFAESAPEGLRSRLGGSTTGGVELVTFEYAYVTVNRPWFMPQLFSSTAWRFPPGIDPLSDGGTAAIGRCTAYVTGLVLARSITVQRHTGAAEAPDLGFLPSAKWSKFIARDSSQPRPPLATPFVSSRTKANLAVKPAQLTVSAVTEGRYRIKELFPSMRHSADISRPRRRQIAQR